MVVCELNQRYCNQDGVGPKIDNCPLRECPTLGSPDLGNDIAFYTRATLDHIMNKLCKQSDCFKAINQKRSSGDTAVNSLEECTRELERLRDLLNQKRDQCEAIENERTEATDSLKQCTAELERLKNLLKRKDGKLEALVGENECLCEAAELSKRKLDDLDYQVQKLDEDTRYMEQGIVESIGLIQDIGDVAQENEWLKGQVSNLKDSEAQKLFDDLTQKLDDCKEHAKLLEEINKALKETLQSLGINPNDIEIKIKQTKVSERELQDKDLLELKRSESLGDYNSTKASELAMEQKDSKSSLQDPSTSGKSKAEPGRGLRPDNMSSEEETYDSEKGTGPHGNFTSQIQGAAHSELTGTGYGAEAKPLAGSGSQQGEKGRGPDTVKEAVLGIGTNQGVGKQVGPAAEPKTGPNIRKILSADSAQGTGTGLGTREERDKGQEGLFVARKEDEMKLGRAVEDGPTAGAVTADGAGPGAGTGLAAGGGPAAGAGRSAEVGPATGAGHASGAGPAAGADTAAGAGPADGAGPAAGAGPSDGSGSGGEQRAKQLDRTVQGPAARAGERQSALQVTGPKEVQGSGPSEGKAGVRAETGKKQMDGTLLEPAAGARLAQTVGPGGVQSGAPIRGMELIAGQETIPRPGQEIIQETGKEAIPGSKQGPLTATGVGQGFVRGALGGTGIGKGDVPRDQKGGRRGSQLKAGRAGESKGKGIGVSGQEIINSKLGRIGRESGTDARGYKKKVEPISSASASSARGSLGTGLLGKAGRKGTKEKSASSQCMENGQFDDFVRHTVQSLAAGDIDGCGLETELRKILDMFIDECGFGFCKCNIPKSRFYATCHKLFHHGLHTLDFKELAYMHKRIYAAAENILPGCLFNMIVKDISRISCATPVLEPYNSSRLHTQSSTKCCCCKSTMCCDANEEKLMRKVIRLESDIENAKMCLMNLKGIPSRLSIPSCRLNGDNSSTKVY